jgi:hypothetical protein
MKLGALLKGEVFKKVVAEFWGTRGSFAVRHFSNGFEGFEKSMKSPKYFYFLKMFNFNKIFDFRSTS